MCCKNKKKEFCGYILCNSCYIFFFISSHSGGLLKHVSYTGMCCPNGSFFHRKSSDMGPLFRGKTLRHGSVFSKGTKFWCLPSKMSQIFKNRPTFREKSLEMGYFLAKMTLRKGWSFWGSGGTPPSKWNPSTPSHPGLTPRYTFHTRNKRGCDLYMSTVYCLHLYEMR